MLALLTAALTAIPTPTATTQPITLRSVNLFPVAHTIKVDFIPQHIVTDTIRPDLKSPLAAPFCFKLLNLWRWAERILLKTPERLKDLALHGSWQRVEVAPEGRRKN